MAKNDIRQYSLDDLKTMRDRGESRTRPDAPPVEPDADLWDNARVVMPAPGKASVHLRVDSDVLEWFKAQGKGHLTRMNAVLRSYVEAQKRTPTRLAPDDN
jgi:uncharacterized protein (DUF4415 family)